MANTIKLADLNQIIKEAFDATVSNIDGKVTDTNAKKAFDSISKENAKTSKEQYQDGDKRVKTNTPEGKGESVKGVTPDNKKADSAPFTTGRNALNLKYDSMDDKYQKRVKALVMGKASPEQADIDDAGSGVSTKGNEKFYKEVQTANNGYDKILDATFINNRIALPKRSGGQFATENKVRVGDVFIESKNNLSLKVTGLTEDKKRLNFVNESGQKYSMSVDKFKTAIKEQKILSEGWADEKPVGWDTNSKFKITNFEDNNGIYAIDKVENGMYWMSRIDGPPHRFNPGAGTINLCVSNGDWIVVDSESSEQQPQQDPMEANESKKTKRLKLNKTSFISESHAISLIPEQYKKAGNKFMMIDNAGNELMIECDKYNKPIVVEFKNAIKAKSDFDRMKNLWEYNPGNAVGKPTLNEEKIQKDLHKKTKRLNENATKKVE